MNPRLNLCDSMGSIRERCRDSCANRDSAVVLASHLRGSSLDFRLEKTIAMNGRALLRLVPGSDGPARKVVHDARGRAIWTEELPPDIADGLSLESPPTS